MRRLDDGHAQFAPMAGHPNTTLNSAGSEQGYYQLPPLRLLAPFLWALGFSAGTYVLMAYLEARKEVSAPSAVLQAIQWPQFRKQQPMSPTEVLTATWNDLDSVSQLSFGLIAGNGAAYLADKLSRGRIFERMAHVPIVPRNWTLLSSTFVHFGVGHILFNMWACYQFLPAAGHSQLLGGSVYHTLAFILPSAVLSGYAQHLAAWPSAMNALRGTPSSYAFLARSGGMSGLLFAVLGAFCMEYPNAGVGIVFLPFSMAAINFLPCVMAFDLYGMVRGYPGLNFGHAAHLAGAMIGAGYSYLDGRNRFWRPLVKFFRRRIQQRH